MPILVVKFPEEAGKKVNMSRFLSKYKKREFSVIIDVDLADLPRIFEILNRNDCTVIIAKDESLKIDYETYFLLINLNRKIKEQESMETSDAEEKNKKEVKSKKIKLLDPLQNEVIIQRFINKFNRYSKLYNSKFEKEYILTKNGELSFDWYYRTRVLFDSITIVAIDLNQKIKPLEEKKQLDIRFKFLYAINSGYNTIGDIANFLELEDIDEFNKLEELLHLQVIKKNPYELTEEGRTMLKFIVKDNLNKKITYVLNKSKESFLKDITENDYTRYLTNLLTNLCLLTIKNRIETGYFKDFKEFKNLSIDPNEYK